jgi:hypothetical protein
MAEIIDFILPGFHPGPVEPLERASQSDFLGQACFSINKFQITSERGVEFIRTQYVD